MQRPSRPGSLDLPQSQMQRNHSLSGDRLSISAATSLASPPPVSPDPAYIAASAASQIVTSDHQSQIDDWFDESGGRMDAEPITVSPASLVLINGFLDQLLFSILAFARSTSIASLRPAVTEVLKPRLAKDAINGADEELEEFLGGGNAEEPSPFHNGPESKAKWDLNLIWRRTRLRCMVYTRLGDMEEEDEEMYIEQERMEDVGNADHWISQELGMISPAAAIFLTSILEFIGEHALMVAGEAASNRKEIKQYRDERRNSSDNESPRLVVEDTDVEKLGFNTTLGRLWRSWKKRVRAPSISNNSRPLSREVMRRRAASTSASPSLSEADDPIYLHETMQRPSVEEVLEEEQEPPGASKDRETVDTVNADDPDIMVPTDATAIGHRGNRPQSMMVYTQLCSDKLALPNQLSPSRNPRSSLPSHVYPKSRKRSSSLPTPIIPYGSPWDEIFETSLKKREALLSAAYDGFLGQDSIPPLKEDPDFISEDDYMSDSDAMIPHGNQDGIDLGTLSGYTGPQSSQGVDSNTADAAEIHVYNGNRGGFQSREPSGTPSMSNRSSLEPSLTASQNPVPAESPVLGQIAVSTSAKKDDPIPDLDERRAIENEEVREQNDHQPPTSSESTKGISGKDWNKHLNSLQDDAPTTLAMLQGQKPRTETSSIPRSDPTTVNPVYPSMEFHGHDRRPAPIKPIAYVSGPEHGVPSLTPLRELMENAQDTSDDSSSFGPGHNSSKPEKPIPTKHLPSNDPPSPRSSNSPTISHTKHSSGGSKRSDLRKELPAVNTAGAERAAVQRITQSPVFARDSVLPAARTSTSSNRDVRPHTSASGTSQLSHKIKGLIGRESIDGNVQPMLIRHSSGESGSSLSDKPFTQSPKPLTKQQSFEQLIKSDETIQYTLTPKNMRDMETANNSQLSSDYGSEAVGAVDPYRSNDPLSAEPGTRPITGLSIVSLKGLNGLRANPPPVGSKRHGSSSTQTPTAKPTAVKSRTPSASINGNISGSGRASASGRNKNVEPRDARAKKETTSEIADFIRSTGPEIIPRHASSLSNKTLSGPSVMASGSQRNSTQRASKQYSGSTAGTPRRTSSKLQARDPTVSYDSQTSDLIDFIRQGPAHDRTDGSHRISRAVAPFRRTMDSDEIQALGNGKSKETSSVASTQDSLANTKSVHSSSNSRTGLLENSRRANGKNNSLALAVSKPPRTDEPPHPPRKQYRTKDPYPIDSDSDEGDRIYRPKASGHEESLIDFLRSVTPQGGSNIPSAFDGVPRPNRETIRRKNSGNNIREQVVRTASSQSSKTSGSKNTIGPASISSSTRRKTGSSQLPPPSPRETSPHLITQTGTIFDTYKPTKPTYAAHIDRERNASHRRHPQARPEREPDSNINELADFFKNSGPPTPPMEKVPLPINPRIQKEESGFGRIFSRKKRSTGRL